MKKMLILFLCVYGNIHPTNALSVVTGSDTQLTDAIIGISNDFQSMQAIPRPAMWPQNSPTMTINQYLDFLEAQLDQTKKYAQSIINYCDRATEKLVVAKECVKENSGQ